MNIAIIAASGKQGQKLLNEAIKRDLNVTAVVRNGRKISQDVAVLEKDVLDLTREDLQGFDVILNAFGTDSENAHRHVTVGQHLIELLQHTNQRLLVVGGAGSLFVNPEQSVRLVDTPEFPEIYKPIAQAQLQNLQDLQKAQHLNWAFLSPAAFFDPDGRRTDLFQVGGQKMMFNSQNQSYVSYADYAIAMLDEVEMPKHHNQHFSVVGEAG